MQTFLVALSYMLLPSDEDEERIEQASKQQVIPNQSSPRRRRGFKLQAVQATKQHGKSTRPSSHSYPHNSGVRDSESFCTYPPYTFASGEAGFYTTISHNTDFQRLVIKYSHYFSGSKVSNNTCQIRHLGVGEGTTVKPPIQRKVAN